MYDDATYLQHDPYDLADCDIEVRGRKTRIVTTRKEQRCVPPLDDPHDVPPGTRCWQESAFVEGAPARNYVCLACMDKWIETVAPNYCSAAKNDIAPPSNPAQKPRNRAE